MDVKRHIIEIQNLWVKNEKIVKEKYSANNTVDINLTQDEKNITTAVIMTELFSKVATKNKIRSDFEEAHNSSHDKKYSEVMNQSIYDFAKHKSSNEKIPKR